MSEHTENIRRAVKIGYDKLVDALDRMEKERDKALVEVTDLKKKLSITEVVEIQQDICDCVVCQKRRKFPSPKEEICTGYANNCSCKDCMATEADTFR